MRDKSGQVIRQTWLPGGLDFGTPGAPLQYTPGNLLYSASGFITSTSYEADNQTREIVYANGIRTAFSYSPLRRWLTRVRTTNSGGAVLMDMTYTRDAAGRITAIDGAPRPPTRRAPPTTGPDRDDRLFR